MGIRGLTGYISNNSRKFYEPLQLRDCTLVIDGCSLACQLYTQASECRSVFGGDYDHYAQEIDSFFSSLEKCNIMPVVIIDGGYEGRKLKTILSRFKDKINAAKICTPSNQRGSVVFPLLLMEAFKQTLLKRNVKFVQTDFEADHEIAAIGRLLNSPVLSNDSDFYISDVMYIPFPTLNSCPLKIEQENCVKYYLNCQVYKVERLVSTFGGFDRRLLPLISFLLGNDYVNSCVFHKFVEQIMLPKYKKTSPQHGKLSSIFEWLKTETLESATAKMLNHLKKKQRAYVKHQIELAIAANSCFHSEFTSYLGLDKEGFETVTAVPSCGLMSPSSEQDTSENSEDDGDDSDCDLDEENESHEANSLFPLRLREKFRKGELPTFLSDIFHLHLYFCHPQVDDFSCSDSHSLSFPILKIIYGFLQHGAEVESPDKIDGSLTCYTRSVTAGCQMIELQPTKELPGFSPLPSLLTLSSLPLSVRKQLLFSSLCIFDKKDVDIVETLSEDWKLFASVVIFWARTTSFPKITCHHLHSLLICMIALGVVDRIVGRIRNKKKLASKRAHCLKNVNQENNESSNLKTQGNVHLLKISVSECLSLAESLLPFYQFQSKQFSRQIVHVFAQFQACLSMAMTLNSLLEFPVSQCQLSETFSGSLAYAAFVNLKNKKDVGAYVSTLMGTAPSLYQMYKDIQDKLTSLLPELDVCIKGRRKTKNKSCRPTPKENLAQQGKGAPSGSQTNISNNRFSLLSA
ncbi:protein asteroid [Thrips palmi]|uniref:Protein asteroid n=1 Tax=Thrips palmi TaxID=161013 RepID=A0A6P8Y4N2_THRPL|nr:protein asteroid [Thrips palmi]XP_034230982.1 protein asteroid [Thrips palmi]